MTGLEDTGHLLVGAANGIGLATAELLAERGARVAIVDRDRGALERARQRLGAALVAAVEADLLDDATTDRAVATATAALGRVDGLVNCAGVDYERPLEDMPDAEWDRLMSINLRAPMRVCRAAHAALAAAAATARAASAKGSSSIVNVASAAGLSPLPARTAYCTSKAALVMMSKTLALEWAPMGIRVNAVCPGIVDTALFRTSWEEAADPAARLATIKHRYPMARIADPAELAEAIVFLCSPAASFVTGTAMAVDGGRTFH